MTPEDVALLVAAINSLRDAIVAMSQFDEAVFNLVVTKSLVLFAVGFGTGLIISTVRKMRA